MDRFHRRDSARQVSLLQHTDARSKRVLSRLYRNNLVSQISDPQAFLRARAAAVGPNFAALGKLHVGSYADVADLIRAPQLRGYHLGQAQLIPERVGDDFLLAMSDPEAGGDDRHVVLREAISRTIIAGAADRLADGQLDGFAAQAAAALPASTDPEALAEPVAHYVLRSIFYLLFGMHLPDEELPALATFCLTGGPTTRWVYSLVRPLGAPDILLSGVRTMEDSILQSICASPALSDYQPGPENGNRTIQEFARALFPIVIIAAITGTSGLCMAALTRIPADHPLDLDDRQQVLKAILEAGRLKPPVNRVNLLLPEARSFIVAGTPTFFPANTLVAACLFLACQEEAVFPEPHRFNPSRENLLSDVLIFNAVGFSEGADGARRSCPGRHLAVTITAALLRASRASAAL